MPRPDALDHLLGMPQFANVADDARKPGLANMHTLLDEMGNPHDALRAVHVAGTNGKGSVSAMIAAIATAAGLRTGLHTSPHLTHVTQRMRVNGSPAPTDWLVDALETYRPLVDQVQPSFFELTVALTFRYFAEQEVDLAVVEVGLGGRLDSTNVLSPALAVITNIDLDHTDLLGDTLGDIAREKAGIIKPQTPVLSGVTKDEAGTAIAEVAAGQDAPLHALRDEVTWHAHQSDLTGSTLEVKTPLRTYDRVRVSVPGPHQQANAALALRAAEFVVPGVQESASPVREGLRDVQGRTGFRGRMDVIQEVPLIVVDVAHNPPGIAAGLETLAPALDERAGTLYVCFNAVEGKGLPEVAELLAAYDAHVIPIPIDTKRALPPDEIAETLRSHGVTVHTHRSLDQALTDYQRHAEADDVLLLTGSHKMVEVLPDEWISSS